MFDNLDQLYTFDKKQSVKIISKNLDATISGVSLKFFEEGIATFENLVFSSKPKSTSDGYSLDTLALDEDFLNSTQSLSLQRTLTVSFRECLPGEQLVNGMCLPC